MEGYRGTLSSSPYPLSGTETMLPPCSVRRVTNVILTPLSVLHVVRATQRNIHDRTGLEPSKLYNLVQFLMYDAPSQTQQGGGGGQVDPLAVSGTISVDNTMKMLYSR